MTYAPPLELSQPFLSAMFSPIVFLSSACKVPNAKVLCLLIPLSKESAGLVPLGLEVLECLITPELEVLGA